MHKDPQSLKLVLHLAFFIPYKLSMNTINLAPAHNNDIVLTRCVMKYYDLYLHIIVCHIIFLRQHMCMVIFLFLIFLLHCTFSSSLSLQPLSLCVSFFLTCTAIAVCLISVLDYGLVLLCSLSCTKSRIYIFFIIHGPSTLIE